MQQQNGSMFHTRVDYRHQRQQQALRYLRSADSRSRRIPSLTATLPPALCSFPVSVTSGDISNIFSVTYTHVFGASGDERIQRGSFTDQRSRQRRQSSGGRPLHHQRLQLQRPQPRVPPAPAAPPATATSTTLASSRTRATTPFLRSTTTAIWAIPTLLMPGGFYNNQVHVKKEVPDFQDAVSWFKGKHTFKFGVLLREGHLQRSGGLSAPIRRARTPSIRRTPTTTTAPRLDRLRSSPAARTLIRPATAATPGQLIWAPASTRTP